MTSRGVGKTDSHHWSGPGPGELCSSPRTACEASLRACDGASLGHMPPDWEPVMSRLQHEPALSTGEGPVVGAGGGAHQDEGSLELASSLGSFCIFLTESLPLRSCAPALGSQRWSHGPVLHPGCVTGPGSGPCDNCPSPFSRSSWCVCSCEACHQRH